MTSKTDSKEFDTRVRRALMEENTGLRRMRHSRVEWRAVQALMSAVGA